MYDLCCIAQTTHKPVYTSSAKQTTSNKSLLSYYINFAIRGTCSIGEVSKVQRELQECSHNVSLKLFHEIQSLNEGNGGMVHTTRPVVPGLRSRSGIRGKKRFFFYPGQGSIL